MSRPFCFRGAQPTPMVMPMFTAVPTQSMTLIYMNHKSEALTFGLLAQG